MSNKPINNAVFLARNVNKTKRLKKETLTRETSRTTGKARKPTVKQKAALATRATELAEALEDEVNTLKATLSEISDKLRDTEQRLTAANMKLNIYEEEAMSLRTQLGTVVTERDDLKAKVGRLESKLAEANLATA